MKGKNIFIIVAVAVVFGGGGFWGGISYQKGKSPTPPGGRNFSGNRGDNLRGANGVGGLVNGEVTSVDDASITVKTQDGSSKIVYFSDSTNIVKSSKTDKSELKSGSKVTTMGTSNQDGSVTAKNIQIEP